MNPPPPTAPGNGVATLMAEIERIAQELRAYNKRPLPATEDQVQALVKLAERDRPLTLHVNSEAVARQLVGHVEQQAKLFQDTGNALITYLDNRQRLLTSALDERVAALKAAEVSLQATTQRIPKQVPLDVVANWRSTLGFTLGPVVVVLLGMLVGGHFSRVPEEELARVQAELAQTRREVQLFRQYRTTLVKERPEIAYQYFPYTGDPKPVAPVVKEKKRAKR